MIKDEEVEPGEVWCEQGELLTQRRLRQAQRRAEAEPVGLSVEEHEGAVITSAGEIETSDENAIKRAHTLSGASGRRGEKTAGANPEANPGAISDYLIFIQ